MNINFWIAIAITVVISYLLGSCNFAIISVRLLKGVDIRDYGSKNAGLTNTLRVFGKTPAIITLIGDLSKGIAAVWLSQLAFYLLDTGLLVESIGSEPVYYTHFVGCVAAIFAVIGHVFPIYYKFKGGKGVLVAGASLLTIDPIIFCIVIPIFIVMVVLTRYISLSSITAAAIYPFVTLFIHISRGDQYTWLVTILVALVSAMIIFMHRENIKRLKAGTENKFGSKKKN